MHKAWQCHVPYSAACFVPSGSSHVQPSVDTHAYSFDTFARAGSPLVRWLLHAPLAEASQFGCVVHEPGRYFEHSRGSPVHAPGAADRAARCGRRIRARDDTSAGMPGGHWSFEPKGPLLLRGPMPAGRRLRRRHAHTHVVGEYARWSRSRGRHRVDRTRVPGRVRARAPASLRLRRRGLGERPRLRSGLVLE